MAALEQASSAEVFQCFRRGIVAAHQECGRRCGEDNEFPVSTIGRKGNRGVTIAEVSRDRLDIEIHGDAGLTTVREPAWEDW